MKLLSVASALALGICKVLGEPEFVTDKMTDDELREDPEPGAVRTSASF